MRLLPRERIALETLLPPEAVLARVPGAVDEANRGALLLGIRCEVGDGRVRVGYWPQVAFTRGGIAFEGAVTTRDGRTVVAGDVSLFPRPYAALVGVALVVAAIGPLVDGIRGGHPWLGVLGAAWLAGGARIAMEVLFRAYRRRIERALRGAAGGEGRARPQRRP